MAQKKKKKLIFPKTVVTTITAAETLTHLTYKTITCISLCYRIEYENTRTIPRLFYGCKHIGMYNIIYLFIFDAV